MKQLNTAKAVAVASIGGGLEIYDFTIYIFLTPVLAKLFFPLTNHDLALLSTLGVFAVGYIARPIGGIIFGHFGDTLGRKWGMLISIFLMAIAATLIGLLPTYAQIGVVAPIALVVLRFLQGIAVGGDLPGAITSVAEYASPERRGLLCGIVFGSINAGALLASSMVAILTLLLSTEQLEQWGWRIAFIMGIVIAVVGYYLRRKVGETPYFAKLQQKHAYVKRPLINLLKTTPLLILQALGLMWLFAVATSQCFLYMPTYLHQTIKLPLKTAMIINSINLIIFSSLIPVMGYISDKVGRKRLLLVGSLTFILLSYPLYILLNSQHLPIQLIALFILAVMTATLVGTTPCAVCELFVTKTRYSGTALSYNLALTLFASLTPVVLSSLLYLTHNNYAVSFNLILAAMVTFMITLTIEERSRKPLT